MQQSLKSEAASLPGLHLDLEEDHQNRVEQEIGEFLIPSLKDAGAVERRGTHGGSARNGRRLSRPTEVKYPKIMSVPMNDLWGNPFRLNLCRRSR